MLGILLAPKRFFTFFFNEYVAPLSAPERLFLLAAMLMSLVSATGVYGRLTDAYGHYVGLGGATGLECLYIGSALAGTRAKGFTKLGMILMSAIAIFVAIVLNLAQQQAVGNLAWYGPVEAVAFPALAMLASLVAHGISGARHVEEEKHVERDRQRKERQEDDERRAKRATEEREQQARLYTDSQVAVIKAKAEARASQSASRDVTDDASQGRHKASGSRKTVDRAKMFVTLRDAVTANPNFSRQAFADAHGISRPMVNKLIKELEAIDGMQYIKAQAAD